MQHKPYERQDSVMLDETLRAVARRYRVPPLDAAVALTRDTRPSTALALAIEAARKAIESKRAPDAQSKRDFIDALARMIRDAMRADSGDPAFQATVLRHQAAQVREYASLSAHVAQDRRWLRSAVTAIAHPRKQERTPPGVHREALARLYAASSETSIAALGDTLRALIDTPEIANDASLLRALTHLRDSDALRRMLHLDALQADALVQRYRSLWERNGLRPGSAAALAQGVAAQRRGADAEASAARALEALAQRLDEEEGEAASYRVVTSMRVPASLAAGHARAKTEWDAVLLRRAHRSDDATSAWDVCVLVEAKASVDAATTDFASLLRGLRLLARADANLDYVFETREGAMRLRGASLCALRTDEAALERSVLYACDAADESALRVLGAAARMRLMTAQASLDYAGHLADEHRLEPVWHALLESPQWKPVLDQYATLKQVRELMIHPDDLLTAIDGIGQTE